MYDIIHIYMFALNFIDRVFQSTESEYHGEALQIAESRQNRYCSVEQHIFGHNNNIKMARSNILYFLSSKMVTIKIVDEPLR